MRISRPKKQKNRKLYALLKFNKAIKLNSKGRQFKHKVTVVGDPDQFKFLGNCVPSPPLSQD